ncbi:phage tail assembly protein T [Providencia rettgeri]|uniref:phage tail assembly protein T n=2 Tax=Providencia TaxID=586 RepID=UPI0024ABAEB0|nr:phage tail assembly protein T [Providencia rettgeri]
MRLAREFGRPDWRRMLSEMSASEFSDWVAHFSKTPFMPQLVDIEFAALHTSLYMAMGGTKTELTDFMLLTDVEADEGGMSDEAIQLASEGISGGVRYEQPNSGS